MVRSPTSTPTPEIPTAAPVVEPVAESTPMPSRTPNAHAGGRVVQGRSPSASARSAYVPRVSRLPDRLSPELEKALQNQERFGPEGLPNLRFKVELLDMLDHCAGSRVRTSGKIHLVFKSKPKEDGSKEIVGESAEAVDSQLDPAEDRVIVECVQKFFVGNQETMNETEGGEYTRHTEIAFPIGEDKTYKFLADPANN
jgi:hypothetical protein